VHRPLGEQQQAGGTDVTALGTAPAPPFASLGATAKSAPSAGRSGSFGVVLAPTIVFEAVSSCVIVMGTGLGPFVVVVHRLSYSYRSDGPFV